MKKSIKVDEKVLSKVKRHIKKTKQSIGGFYDLAVEEKIERDNRPQYYPPYPNHLQNPIHD